MTGFTSAQALSDEVPNLLVTRPGIVQKYSEVFLPIRRIDGQETQLKGGYKPLSVFQHAAGEAPILQDVDCPGARVFGLNTNYLKKLDLVGEEWASFDGAEIAEGAHVVNSIVGVGAVVGAGAVLRGAVIGDGAVVGRGNELLDGVRVWPGAKLADGAVRFSSDA